MVSVHPVVRVFPYISISPLSVMLLAHHLNHGILYICAIPRPLGQLGQNIDTTAEFRTAILGPPRSGLGTTGATTHVDGRIGTVAPLAAAISPPHARALEAHADQAAGDPVLVGLGPAALLHAERVLEYLRQRDVAQR